MVDFNQVKTSYREDIERSIAFTGADHQFFIAEKGKLILDLIAQHFPAEVRAKLLDVGCGHGFVHSCLVEGGIEVTGVEIADEVLALARAENPAVDYRPYDGNVLPFSDGSFDIVTAMCVLHHVPVPNWSGFVEELRRVLRPGGLIVIFEHNPLNPVTTYLFKYGFNGLDKGATMVRRRRLEGLLGAAGCSAVRSSYIFFTPFGGHFFRSMDRMLEWLPLGAQYFTVAQR